MELKLTQVTFKDERKADSHHTFTSRHTFKELQFLYKAKLRKYIERIDISLMLDLLSFKLTFSELLRGQKMSSSIFSETCLEWRRVLQWKCVKERNVRNEIEDTQCSGLCFFHSYQKNANGTSTVRPETSRPFEHFIP